MTSQMGRAIWATDLAPHLPCCVPSSLGHTPSHSRELCCHGGLSLRLGDATLQHVASAQRALLKTQDAYLLSYSGPFLLVFLKLITPFTFKIYPFKSTFYCYYFCLFGYTLLFLYGFELLFFFHADPLSISKFQTSIDFYHSFYCLLDLG